MYYYLVESTTGEIINLMSVDIQRIVSILLFINSIWSCPLQIALAIYFLYQTLGASVFAGVGTMVLLIPVNTFVTKQVQKLQVKQMKFKDQRVKLINEVLSGIKVGVHVQSNVSWMGFGEGFQPLFYVYRC